MRYLTEKILGEVLKKLYPNNTFIHDKSVPNSGSRRRPDYRCDELMLIVEFDGLHHYVNAEKILNEEEKTNMYESMGYKVIRVPYFVQITTDTIRHLFGIVFEHEQEYPHGFVDEKCVLPCDFCELGIEKFQKDLLSFDYILDDITHSLKNKVEIKGDIRRVLPKSLEYLVK